MSETSEAPKKLPKGSRMKSSEDIQPTVSATRRRRVTSSGGRDTVVESEAFPNEIKLLRRLKSNPTNREDVKDCKANLLTNQRSLQIGPVYG